MVVYWALNFMFLSAVRGLYRYVRVCKKMVFFFVGFSSVFVVVRVLLCLRVLAFFLAILLLFSDNIFYFFTPCKR